MNEEFEKLMYEAGLTADGCWSDMDRYDRAAITKFAQLIVKECITLMNDEKEYFSKPDPYQPSDYYERCRAKEDAFEDAARLIKNHFGI